MSFSKAQQGLFRPLVTNAWNRHCKANAVDQKNKALRDCWYREELESAVGKESTSECNQAQDFEAVMAHFEAIIGDSILWQMRQFRGNANRILHNISEYSEQHQIDEEYLRGIARQALKTNYLPDLCTLTPEQLLIILRAVKIYCRRHLNKDPF